MIKAYTLHIKLKSDLCSSNGESFGTFVDSDICYDDHGIPYIASKRIKGILRENAYEFLDWQNEITKDDLDNLFGVSGSNKSGNLRINNACIEDYEAITDKLDNLDEVDKRYLSKQRMINFYTYVRYQTAIDDETGTSKDNSLRTIRAVKRGNEFRAIVEINYESEEEIEKIENYLKNIVRTMTHIGMNRTRGFGEVKCILSNRYVNDEDNAKEEIANYNTLKILFKADSDIIVSKQNSEISESYIPGINILGNIAKKYINEHGKDINKEYINLFLNGNVKYSNAYISNQEGKEFYPVPFSYAKVKNTTDRFHNKMYDVNEIGIQLSSLTDKYVTLDKDNYMLSVKMNENLHHQRPNDKSIGHASENNGSFYQFVAIKKGQYFYSKIIGNEKDLNIIKKLINEKDAFYVGKSKTAEYGKLVIEKIIYQNNNQDIKKYNHFALLLTSDAIVLNKDTSLASNNKKDLIEKIKEVLNIKDDNIVSMIECNNSIDGSRKRKTREFINYGKASGYNIIWNLPKEQQDVFLAGSILEFKLENSIELKDEYYIGQRQAEGYGNIKVIDLNADSSEIKLKKYMNLKKDIEITPNFKKLYMKLIKEVIYEDIITYIQKSVKNKLVSLNNTTIGRSLLMLKQSNNSNEFMESVNAIKDDKKLEKVKKVITSFDINKFKNLDSVKRLNEIDSNQLNSAELIDNYMMFYYKKCFEIIKIEGEKE